MLTGAEDGSAFLSNVQSGRILGQLHGKFKPTSMLYINCTVHVQQVMARLASLGRCTGIPPILACMGIEAAHFMLPVPCHLGLAGHTDSVESIQMSTEVPFSVTGAVDGNLIIWDNSTLAIRSTCTHPEVQDAQATILTACRTLIWQHAVIHAWACLVLQAVVKVVLHPSAPLVFTACLDGVVRCWDARSGEPSHSY